MQMPMPMRMPMSCSMSMSTGISVCIIMSQSGAEHAAYHVSHQTRGLGVSRFRNINPATGISVWTNDNEKDEISICEAPKADGLLANTVLCNISCVLLIHPLPLNVYYSNYPPPSISASAHTMLSLTYSSLTDSYTRLVSECGILIDAERARTLSPGAVVAL